MSNWHIQTIERIKKLRDWRRYDEAIEEAQKLIASDPEIAHSYSILADIYSHKEDFKSAIHFSKEALKKDPEDYTGSFLLVSSYYQSGDMKTFDHAVEDALRIYPDVAHFYYLKALRAFQKNKLKDSLKLMESALAYESEEPVYLAAYSDFLLLANKKKESREFERIALEKNENDPHVFYSLANTAFNRGDFKQARELSRLAAEIEPEEETYREQYMELLKTAYPIHTFFLRVIQVNSFLRRRSAVLFWIIMIFIFFAFNPLFWLYLLFTLCPYYISNFLTGLFVRRKLGITRRRRNVNISTAILTGLFIILIGMGAASIFME
ncbi:tetratricopeptide repeat protein [Bacillus sp. CMF21]|uniref:tetratricopeptide repeat protein n=1 Tax=Metabacillus dongyingensis TaxID=2874282 RepID=UPI001CBC92E5|nr:tetratricopeptide repeat protein [Metabacillus dongyingensis]UAL52512.1 tetratricopeptide repeat protein [Metabacillus dongyingensis]UOK58205.1 tetratricopeptide repeat protein [Bacillus sp. OVS6]USK28821.1 tetratricopeptide repeat protein [Bacillus sp. CMF21]